MGDRAAADCSPRLGRRRRRLAVKERRAGEINIDFASAQSGQNQRLIAQMHTAVCTEVGKPQAKAEGRASGAEGLGALAQCLDKAIGEMLQLAAI